MTTENSVLMKMARETLKGKWGLAIGAFLVVYLIGGAIQAIPKGGGRLGPNSKPIISYPLATFFIKYPLFLTCLQK